uniref:Uncharacterized protein n=1 Tax=Glossina palpalis gambiensis TaxID=67801 RepID=A0A1B0AQV2_9MUSC
MPETFPTMDFDKSLGKCGDFDRYQLLLLALFGLISITVSMHYFTQTVLGFHEKLENRSYDEIVAIYSKSPNPSCTRLSDVNGLNATASTWKCSRWIYKYDFGYRSMKTELNWICDASYKSTTGQSLFFIGSVVGTLFYGLLSHKIDRLPALILANSSGFVGDFSTIFTKHQSPLLSNADLYRAWLQIQTST